MSRIYAVILAAVVLAGCERVVVDIYCPSQISMAALTVLSDDFREARQGETDFLRRYANSIDDFCVRVSLLHWAEYFENKARAKQYMAEIRGRFPAPTGLIR